MVTAVERGRRLAITFGEGEDSIEILIDPVNAKTGATLLQVFIGVENALFADESEFKEAGQALGELALGKLIPRDPANPTEAEQRQLTRFSEVWAQVESLRRDESTEAVAIAFYWQTDGGMEAVREYLSGGAPKAQAVLFKAAGLQRRAASPISESPESPSGESENPTP